MIEEILPSNVVVVDADADRLDIELFPAEATALGAAVERRRREFITVRACARDALSCLDVEPVPVIPGEAGQPLWPPGVVGSITHCAVYRACAVARQTDFMGIGIDAEPNEPLSPGTLARIALASERASLTDLARAEPSICWGSLLLSAKETVYKAWFPLTKSPMTFTDAIVTFDAERRIFHARLQSLQVVVEGRWLARDGLLLTALAVRRSRHQHGGHSVSSSPASHRAYASARS